MIDERKVPDILTQVMVEELVKQNKKLREQIGVARKALLDIARANYGGPSSEERREWTWETAENAFREIEEMGK